MHGPVAPLFVTAKVRRQPEYSPTEDCSNTKWPLYTMDYKLDVNGDDTNKRERIDAERLPGYTMN